MHLKPAVGQPRPVGQAIVKLLFPEGSSGPHAGRIPLVGVAGTRSTSTIARLVAWWIQLSGKPTALACSEGLFLGTRRVERAGKQFWEASHRLLMNREAQAGVFENKAGLILDAGLPYDRCQVGLVTDLDGWEDLARHDIHGPDQMFKVLRTQVDVVLSDGVAVLNAADPRIAEMAPLCDGEVLLYACSADGKLPAVLAEHVRQGGRAATLDQGRVLLHHGQEVHKGPELDHVLTRTGHANDAALREALLAAVATAWAFGISPALLAAGLDTFEFAPPH
jgi:cyanophycin synthetase